MPAPTTVAAVTEIELPAMLRQHLTGWAGALPADDALLVVDSARNAEPGWDGRAPLLTGIADSAGRTVLAVPAAAGQGHAQGAAARLDPRATRHRL